MAIIPSSKSGPSTSRTGASRHLSTSTVTVRSDRVHRSINCDGMFRAPAGDLDLVRGGFDGKVRFYENVGSVTEAVFEQREDQANPFDGIDVSYSSTPALGDIDGDGDLEVTWTSSWALAVTRATTRAMASSTTSRTPGRPRRPSSRRRLEAQTPSTTSMLSNSAMT